MRWVEQLQEHCVPAMEYVPGLLLPVPDALSRRWDHEDQAALDQKQYLIECETERGRRGTDAPVWGENHRPIGWIDTSKFLEGKPGPIDPAGSESHTLSPTAKAEVMPPYLTGIQAKVRSP